MFITQTITPMRKFIVILLSLSVFGAQCRKGPITDSFYFRCFVDGKEYIPNKCANCITCTIYQDTIFILGGNRGFETLGIGINDKYKIKVGTYDLNEITGRKGDYKYSTLVNDRYFTDSYRTGMLNINLIDVNNKIIEGSFYFRAYNEYRNDSVNVTNGSFRLKYNTN